MEIVKYIVGNRFDLNLNLSLFLLYLIRHHLDKAFYI